MNPREAFAIAYRACRISSSLRPENRNPVALAHDAARAVRGARAGPPPKPNRRLSVWQRLRYAHEKAFESRAYWAKYFGNKRTAHGIESLRRDVDYQMWSAWITIASIRSDRGDEVLCDFLMGCRQQFRIALAAFREVQAGEPGVNALACRLLSEKTHEEMPTHLALLAAQGILASRSEAVDLQRVEGREPLVLPGPLLDEVLVPGRLVDDLVPDAGSPDLPVLQQDAG